MRLFVTGARGFIGSHFLRAAAQAGHHLVGLRSPGPGRPNHRVPAPGDMDWLTKDIREVEAKDLLGCDAVVHFCAAGISPRVEPWETMLEVNTMATVRLAEQARLAGLTRLIVAGSYLEYGQSAERYDFIPPEAPLEPTGGYAASKAAAYVALRAYSIQYGLRLAYLRIFSAFGEGQHQANIWPALRKAALAGEDFELTPGEQVRDYVPVEEVAQQFLQATTTTRSTAGEPHVANVGRGKPVALKDFARHWWRKFEAKGNLQVGALPYRKNEGMKYVAKI